MSEHTPGVRRPGPPPHVDGIRDPWVDFLDDMPEPKPRSRAARASVENPRSQVATDPYVNLSLIDEPPFRVTDHDGAVFGEPDTYEIYEITHSVAKGKLYGYGYKVLRNGMIGARPCGDAILIAWSDIPAHLHERLQP